MRGWAWIGRRHEEPQVPISTRSRHSAVRGHGVGDRADGQRRGPEIIIKNDGWTAVTRDGQRSAHFEHSVAITDAGPFVLSKV